MINIETLEVSGFKGAVLGMRNAFKSRDKSDSIFDTLLYGGEKAPLVNIGNEDIRLAQKLLSSGGDDDSKFMRYIHVQADVNAPLYWWKEYDTYKVATVANSESTMHTIMKFPFSMEDFSCEHLTSTAYDYFEMYTLPVLNDLRVKYQEAVKSHDSGANKIWYQLIQILPSSYMQLRTVDLNYQTIRRMYFARRHHKLKEWSGDDGFVGWIKTLPYFNELIAYEQK